MSRKGGFVCIYRGCSSKTGEGISLFTLPNDYVRVRKWLRACNRKDLLNMNIKDLHRNYRLCENHFEEKYISKGGSRKTLFVEALPTIFDHSLKRDSDPLEITAADSLSLFGDSVGNIEFVVESDGQPDDEPESHQIGSKDNPIIIQVTKLKQNTKQLINNKQLSKLPVFNEEHVEVIDLDTPEVEEIKIEEEILQILSDDEKEVELLAIQKETPKQKEVVNNYNEKKKKNICCYVPGCTVDEKEQDKICWFSVPRDENLRKIWDICIDRPDVRLAPGDLICQQHFSENDIICSLTNDKDGKVINTTLKNAIVPCIKLEEVCCVPSCRSKTDQMFFFPVDQISNYHLWVYMIKKPYLRKLKMKEVLKYRVCARHFEPDCFEDNYKLKSTAAPTLFLPEHNIVPLYQEPSKNTYSCAYGDCSNNKLTGKTIFKFPQDPDRCMAWLRACKKPRLITTPSATVYRVNAGKLGVCEHHFEKHQFQSPKQLKPDAVPKSSGENGQEQIRKSKAFSESAELPSPNTMTPPVVTEKSSSSIGLCAYKNCFCKVSENNPFYNFPIDDVRSKKWLEACGLTMSSPSLKYHIIKNQRICSKHFEESMFENKDQLKPEAIPISYKEVPKREAPVGNTEVPTQSAGQEGNYSAVKKNNTLDQGSQLDSSKVIHCAVSTCPNNYGVSPGKGKFPYPHTDPDRFNIWVKLVANPALKGLTPDEIYRKYMVCLRHFEPPFYMKDSKVSNLNEDAVPTKHLAADFQWLFSSDFYETRITQFLKQFAFDLPKDSTLNPKMPGEQSNLGDGNTTCILEADGIRFPKTGHYLYVEQKPNSKRKFPYDVYKFFKTGYGLNEDIMVGEHVRIHTAIIIDDDDECERQVLQQLLDKRRKY